MLAIFVLATGCRKNAPPDPKCVAFVEKILHCDPSAPSTLRQEPERYCPENRRACGEIDTSTQAGCNRFEGCLYDGP
jgi:hypothetical protein